MYMKRKRYKVRIKLIFETTMDHSQESMVKAKNKNLNILNLFQEPPRIIYKVEKYDR